MAEESSEAPAFDPNLEYPTNNPNRPLDPETEKLRDLKAEQRKAAQKEKQKVRAKKREQHKQMEARNALAAAHQATDEELPTRDHPVEPLVEEQQIEEPDTPQKAPGFLRRFFKRAGPKRVATAAVVLGAGAAGAKGWEEAGKYDLDLSGHKIVQVREPEDKPDLRNQPVSTEDQEGDPYEGFRADMVAALTHLDQNCKAAFFEIKVDDDSYFVANFGDANSLRVHSANPSFVGEIEPLQALDPQIGVVGSMGDGSRQAMEISKKLATIADTEVFNQSVPESVINSADYRSRIRIKKAGEAEEAYPFVAGDAFDQNIMVELINLIDSDTLVEITLLKALPKDSPLNALVGEGDAYFLMTYNKTNGYNVRFTVSGADTQTIFNLKSGIEGVKKEGGTTPKLIDPQRLNQMLDMANYFAGFDVAGHLSTTAKEESNLRSILPGPPEDEN